MGKSVNVDRRITKFASILLSGDCNVSFATAMTYYTPDIMQKMVNYSKTQMLRGQTEICPSSEECTSAELVRYSEPLVSSTAPCQCYKSIVYVKHTTLFIPAAIVNMRKKNYVSLRAKKIFISFQEVLDSSILNRQTKNTTTFPAHNYKTFRCVGRGYHVTRI